jgi:hypothetical protein
MDPQLDPSQDPRLRMPPAVLPTANGAPQQTPAPTVLPRAGQVPVPSQATKNPTAQAPLPNTASPEQITGQDAMPVARPAPGSAVQPSADAQARRAELTRLQSSGSGVSQIHNPILRTLGTIGDVAASFFPRAATVIPGTTLHHQMLLRNAGGAVKEDTAEQEAQAREQLQGAEAHEAEAKANQTKEVTPHTLQTAAGIMQFNPETQRFDIPAGQASPKEEVEGKTVTTDQGIMQWDPNTHGYTIRVGGAPEKESGEKALQDENGNWFAPGPNHTMVPITLNGQPFKGKNTEPKQPQFSAIEAAHIRAAGGDPDKPETLTAAVLAKAKQIGEKSTPEPGSLQLVQDNQGNWETFNNKTGKMAPTEAVKPSGLTTSRQQQGSVIKSAGDDLIKEIEAKRGKVGNLGSYWDQAKNGTPISDPDVAGLMTSLASFAALQPTLHGFRGTEALKGFENIIGGIPKNPDALIASIRSIQKTAGNVQHPGANQGAGSGAVETKTKADYDALPTGAHYIKDGQEYVKK